MKAQLYIIILLIFNSIPILTNGQRSSSDSLTILSYGYISLEGVNARKVISKRWNIYYKSLALCGVPIGLEDSIKPLNEVTIQKIEKKYGTDWNVRFNNDVKIEFLLQEKARKVVNEKFIKKIVKDTSKYKSDLSIWLEPTQDRSIYEAKIFGYGWFQEIDQYVIFYKLRVNLNSNKVEIISDKVEKLKL